MTSHIIPGGLISIQVIEAADMRQIRNNCIQLPDGVSRNVRTLKKMKPFLLRVFVLFMLTAFVFY